MNRIKDTCRGCIHKNTNRPTSKGYLGSAGCFGCKDNSNKKTKAQCKKEMEEMKTFVSEMKFGR